MVMGMKAPPEPFMSVVGLPITILGNLFLECYANVFTGDGADPAWAGRLVSECPALSQLSTQFLAPPGGVIWL